MKTSVNMLMPRAVARKMKRYRIERSLDSLQPGLCNTGQLTRIDINDLRNTFNMLIHEEEFKKADVDIQRFAIPTNMGGVNPGDQKALFYLLMTYRPKSVLEIGTHIGSSTVYMASALKHLYGSDKDAKPGLVTVDISDVNNPYSQPWLRYGARFSPDEMIQKLNCKSIVQFVCANSHEYFLKCDDAFDFIFLDGSHAAEDVYLEMTAALKVLNEQGLIILHDYFPDCKPIWIQEEPIPGPFLAFKKLIAELDDLAIMPLGRLPWETKSNSQMTSLAIVHRK